MEEIQQTRIRCARKDSSVYPARLKELPGMPKQLYYIGRFPDDDKPTAAIVEQGCAVLTDGYRHLITENS